MFTDFGGRKPFDVRPPRTITRGAKIRPWGSCVRATDVVAQLLKLVGRFASPIKIGYNFLKRNFIFIE